MPPGGSSADPDPAGARTSTAAARAERAAATEGSHRPLEQPSRLRSPLRWDQLLGLSLAAVVVASQGAGNPQPAAGPSGLCPVRRAPGLVSQSGSSAPGTPGDHSMSHWVRTVSSVLMLNVRWVSTYERLNCPIFRQIFNRTFIYTNADSQFPILFTRLKVLLVDIYF